MAQQGDEAAQQLLAHAQAPTGAENEIREDAVAAALASAMAAIRAPVGPQISQSCGGLSPSDVGLPA